MAKALSGLKMAIAAMPMTGRNVQTSLGPVWISKNKIAQLFTLAGEFKSLEALLRRMMDGAEVDGGDLITVLLQDGGLGAAALITMAAGDGRDPEVRAGVIKLPDEDFQALLAATIDEMAPHGIQELFNRAVAFFSVMQGRLANEDAPADEVESQSEAA